MGSGPVGERAAPNRGQDPPRPIRVKLGRRRREESADALDQIVELEGLGDVVGSSELGRVEALGHAEETSRDTGRFETAIARSSRGTEKTVPRLGIIRARTMSDGDRSSTSQGLVAVVSEHGVEHSSLSAVSIT